MTKLFHQGHAAAASLVATMLLAVPAGAQDQAGNEGGKLPSSEEVARVPLGEIAGAPSGHIAAELDNPLEGNKEAIATGKSLFRAMNCASCHGYGAGGAMGPDLTDPYWRYGGTPAEIYNSIAEGRPQGMPAWGRMLPSGSIWPIVAYIQTLGGSIPADFYHGGKQGDRRDMIIAPGARKTEEIMAGLREPQSERSGPKGTTTKPAESQQSGSGAR